MAGRGQVWLRSSFCCSGVVAHLAVVKLKPAQLPRASAAKGPLESANGYLAAAEHEQPLPALGHDLLAVKFGMECWNGSQKMNRRAASTTSP